jgi:hypothetical protein
LWLVAPKAKAAQLLLKAGRVLKLGKQVSCGGKVLIEIKNSKLGREATQLIERHGGKVVEKVHGGVVKLTGKGKGKIGNLIGLKDKSAREALKLRGGSTSATHVGRSDYWEKTLGEIANMAGEGDNEAKTIMKLVKEAPKKAQKYGGK